MDARTEAGACDVATNILVLLLILLAASVPVGAAIGVLAIIVGEVYSPMPLVRAIAENLWQTGREFILIAIPMFILLGEILLRSGIAQRMYDAMAKWLSWLPGGLMHSNIGACAMFSATSGSSVATAATVSTVALPEVDKRGYNERLFLGTLAAGGTLGILIPPSINLIVYGLLTDTSVPDLYLAGFLPGFLLASLFMLTVMIACLARPDWGGERIRATWRERFVALIDLLPPVVLFVVVVGSIYAGFATPTEAASLGVVFALILAACYGQLSIRMVARAVEGAMTTTAMVMLIILAAVFLNFVLGIAGVIQAMTAGITALGLSPYELLFAIIVFLVVLGCFMETYSMLILTAPLLVPIVAQQDFGLARRRRQQGVVRHHHDHPAGNGADYAACRGQSVCGPGRAGSGLDHGHDFRLAAVRHHHVRDDRPDRSVSPAHTEPFPGLCGAGDFVVLRRFPGLDVLGTGTGDLP